MKTVNVNFPATQYHPEIQTKNQIVLHHTVSDPLSAIGDINSWLSTPDRIATNVIIGLDGTVNKCFPSSMWGSHLGVKADWLKAHKFKDYGTRNVELDKHSIGVEIDCWGGLTKDKNGNLLNAYGKPISDKLEIFEIKDGWRGYKYFQKYSALQIEVVCELLHLYMSCYKIPKYGIMDKGIDLSMEALSGVSGIWSHSSYREDKSDLYPDTDLLAALKTL